jgi:Polyketide cyclase / dehydrase and lipid transport
MLKKLLSIFVVAVAILVVVVATRPSAYHVERSVQIDAPVTIVFGLVRDLKAWGSWSPWDKRDPDMHKTFTPTTSGVGASYAWEGNKKVGKGKMTITDEQPPERLVERLEFIEPFQSVAETSFTFKPAGADGTRATWALDGNNNFVGKAFGLVMNMDRLIGGDFEDGLANLKRISEATKPLPAPAAAALRAQMPGNPP